MRRLIILILTIASIAGANAQGNDVPHIVNFINFIRDIEPRDPDITQQVLFETTKNEADAIHRHGFKGTWLLQYDALIDPRYQDMMREEMAHGCEVGGWWEITQPHVEAAGLTWRGRFPWDWHADKGFAVGYTQQERERLVDVYMEKFRELFGQLPASIGSWFLDAHTMAYMHEKYNIEGCCICRDQVGTDGYTLWGGYWAGAYYPSRVNAYMPAQTPGGQIDLPVFRMLGSDPLYQYNAGVGGAVQSVSTMEPTYENAQKPEWVGWYLRCMTDDPALGFTYLQAGQENSFTWDAFKKGYEVQLPMIAQLQQQGKLKVETLIESARAFRKRHPVTPPTACTAMSDYTDNNGRTIWFNSRYYRTNILWEGQHMNIRDIHLFDERKESPYYNKVCTSNQCIYMTLPVVDGCLWSTADDMAALRIYALTDNGRTEEVLGGEPVITKKGKGMNVSWPLVNRPGEIQLTMTEKRLTIASTDKALRWCLQLNVQPQARLPFIDISGNAITARSEDFDYRVSLRRGHFDDLRAEAGKVFRIVPEKGRVDIEMRNK